MGSSLFSLRLWLSKSWRIGVLMAKGSYLLSERRRLLHRLGEQVYRQKLDGKWDPAAFDELVHQLDRLTKKIAVEEVLINRIRYGKRSAPPAAETRRA